MSARLTRVSYPPRTYSHSAGSDLWNRVHTSMLHYAEIRKTIRPHSTFEVIRRLRLQVAELQETVNSLSIKVQHMQAAPWVKVEALAVSSFPPASVEKAANQILESIQPGATADVVELAERFDLDFRLVAQAFSLLAARGKIVEA